MTRARQLPDPETARVLADPTRRRILDLVVASPAPISIASLTDAIGCHHNAVRQHLAQLCAAGLVTETREQRDQPGRPRLLYVAARTAPPETGAHYRRLARLLLRVVRTGASAREVGREAGRAEADRLGAVSDPVAALQDETARLGFMPSRVRRNDRVELVLNHCPLADAAADDPATVCALHRGLVEGFVDAIGGARVTTLVANDPYRAGCRIRLRECRA